MNWILMAPLIAIIFTCAAVPVLYDGDPG